MKHTISKSGKNKNDSVYAMKWRNLAAQVCTKFELYSARQILQKILDECQTGNNNRVRTNAYLPTP